MRAQNKGCLVQWTSSLPSFAWIRPKIDYVMIVSFTAGGWVQHGMERSGSASQIFAPLGARRRRNSSHTRRSASAPSSAHLLWWHRPHPSQVDIRRAAEDCNACGPPRTEAEIAPSKIDFCVRARATEPAPAPASVAPRGCPLSLRCAHCAQDGRAEPRRRTPLGLRQSSGR